MVIKKLELAELQKLYEEYLHKGDYDVFDVYNFDNKFMKISLILSLLYDNKEKLLKLVTWNSIGTNRMMSFIPRSEAHYYDGTRGFCAVKQFDGSDVRPTMLRTKFGGIYNEKYDVVIGAVDICAMYVKATTELVHPNLLVRYIYKADEEKFHKFTEEGRCKADIGISADYEYFLESYADAVKNGNYGFAEVSISMPPAVYNVYKLQYQLSKVSDISEANHKYIQAYNRFRHAFSQFGGGSDEPKLPFDSL